jgi:hypothetical protein
MTRSMSPLGSSIAVVPPEQRARIDAQHLGDVRPFVARADTNFERFSRLNSANSAFSKHTSVEEGIARSIRECDETKSLVGAEPFDNATDGWPGRGLQRGLAEPGSGAECRRLSVLGISVELATPRIAEILMSQLGFLVVRADELRKLALPRVCRCVSSTGLNSLKQMAGNAMSIIWPYTIKQSRQQA